MGNVINSLFTILASVAAAMRASLGLLGHFWGEGNEVVPKLKQGISATTLTHGSHRKSL